MSEYKLRIAFKRSTDQEAALIVGYKLFQFGAHLDPARMTGIWFLECDIGDGEHMHIPLDNVAYIKEMESKNFEKSTEGHLVS